jgi:hypothetical protein
MGPTVGEPPVPAGTVIWSDEMLTLEPIVKE